MTSARDYHVVSRVEEGDASHDEDDELRSAAALHYHDAVESHETKDGVLRDPLDKHGNRDDVDDATGSFITAVDHGTTTPILNHSPSRVASWLAGHSTTTLVPDNVTAWRGMAWAEGEFAIKLAKFTVVTFGGIGLMFYLVRWMKWENDESLRLQDVWRYEGNLIVTDALFFFVVGRLHRQRGVDHVAWLASCFAANVYSSYITDFAMFRHSFTPYEMHCLWPWQLWVFLVLLVPMVATVGVWHIHYAWRTRVLVQKCVEILFCLTFLLAPLVTSPYFHFHHWLAGLVVGMHLNFDVWWSRASMAWCWGQYINGIAVYGRDPVLTCDYAYFLSTSQRCPYVDCYLEALNDPNHMFDNITVTPMKPPNWHNCSADAYHP